MSTGKFFAIVAATLALFAAGCGGGGGSDPITVKTGSLTPAQFVTRMNAVCSSVRTHFLQDFGRFYQKHKPTPATEETWREEMIEKSVVPDYGERMIPEVSAIGAPPSEKSKVVAFLESLQQRLEEIKAEPKEVNSTPFPFKKTAALAKKFGFKTCSESFG